MCLSTAEPIEEEPNSLDHHAQCAWAMVQKALASGSTAGIPDETVQNLVMAGVRLFAAKVDSERRHFSPIAQQCPLTATDVAVATTELLHAVDLNLFDLSMWASRPRDDEVTDRTGRWS